MEKNKDKERNKQIKKYCRQKCQKLNNNIK